MNHANRINVYFKFGVSVEAFRDKSKAAKPPDINPT